MGVSGDRDKNPRKGDAERLDVLGNGIIGRPVSYERRNLIHLPSKLEERGEFKNGVMMGPTGGASSRR